MYKVYDGDGVGTPITYELKESFEGEIRKEILERYCFDTALENEYEMDTDDGEATVYLCDWINTFEIVQLNLISKHSNNDFWVDVTVEKLETILSSHRETEEVSDEREVA